MSSEPPPSATIHEADRASGGSGAVLWGDEIDFDGAVVRRRQDLDIVVRGDDYKANQRLARDIEAAVGPYQRGAPHTQGAGPLALPHYQQDRPPPEGHSFYETARRKARKKP